MTRKLMLFGVLAILPVICRATNITLQGNFTADDNVQLFSVALATPAAVDFRSYGYAGGTTSTGTVVPTGGFDTVLSLFSGSGVFIEDNDDGSGVRTDPATGLAGDARITANLATGSYIVALTQYDNFSIGNLADGFAETGNPNFTADPTFASGGACPGNMFRDISGTAGRCRDGNWAVDFVNVASVTPVTATPEPSALLLAAVGLALLFAGCRRKRLKPLVLALAAVAVLGSKPAAAQTTGDYSNVNDFMNGQRTLLKTSDIFFVHTDDSGDPLLGSITTSNSQQTLPNNYVSPGYADGSKPLRTFSALMFNQQPEVTITPLYDFRHSGQFALYLSNTETTIWTPFALNDEPVLTDGAVADFDQNDYQELALCFNDGRILVIGPNDVNDLSQGFRRKSPKSTYSET